MHHIPLLFDYDFKIKTDELGSRICTLIECLPERYRAKFSKQINTIIESTKRHIKEQFSSVLINKIDL